MTDVLLTPVEAAATLRVAVNTLKYWRQMRRGPKHINIGRKVMYREADVQHYITSQARLTSI